MNGIHEVKSSILSVSTKCVLDEHLFLQWRLRRESVLLIRITRACSEIGPKKEKVLKLKKQFSRLFLFGII